MITATHSAPGRMVTLLDGREVDSASEEWRHECEARAIADLRTLDERRGKPEADRLRATMKALWEARKKPPG